MYAPVPPDTFTLTRPVESPKQATLLILSTSEKAVGSVIVIEAVLAQERLSVTVTV